MSERIPLNLNLLLAPIGKDVVRCNTKGMFVACPHEGDTIRLTVSAKTYEGEVNRVLHTATIVGALPSQDPRTKESGITLFCTLRELRKPDDDSRD